MYNFVVNTLQTQPQQFGVQPYKQKQTKQLSVVGKHKQQQETINKLPTSQTNTSHLHLNKPDGLRP